MSLKYCVAVLIVSSAFARKSPTYVRINRIDKFENCKEYPDTILRVIDTKLTHFKDKSTQLTAVFEAYVDFNTSEIKVEVSMTKCRHKDQLDNCEPYTVMKSSQFCTFMNVGGQLWSKMMSSIQPAIKCPITKGIYTMHNASIDSTVISLFPIEEGLYWRNTALVQDKKTNRVVICIDIYDVFLKVLKQ